MRSHQEIVQAHGAAKLYRDLREIGLKLSSTTPQRWADRNSIPGEYWLAVSRVTGCTVDELAKIASTRATAKARPRKTPEARP